MAQTVLRSSGCASSLSPKYSMQGWRVRRALLSWLVAIAAPLTAQTAPEIVQGNVTDGASLPISGVAVSITGARSGAARIVHSDAEGRFKAAFFEPEGEYTVLAREPGFAPALRRVFRVANSSVMAVHIVLVRSAYPLAPILVRAPLLPDRRGRERPSIGGLSRDASPGRDLLDDPSDLTALTALAPGVLAVGDSGYAVLGTSPDQNSTLLDGMSLEEGNVPPDAQCSVRFATTTSDVSRGRFAGGQTSVSSCKGRDWFESTVRARIGDPILSWADPSSALPASRSLMVTGFAAGPIRLGVAHYHFAFSGVTSSTPGRTLLSGNQAQVAAFGLSVDTVAAVVSALQAAHSPLSVAGASASYVTRRGSGQLTIDWNSGASDSWVLTANGSTNTTLGVGLTPTALPISSAESHLTNGRIMLRRTALTGDVTDDLTVAASGSGASTTPVSPLPGAIVQVGAAYAGGATGLALLRFGGAGTITRRTRQVVDVRHEIVHSPSGSAGRIQFGQQVTLDHSIGGPVQDSVGQFTYESISALSTNQPSSYSRVFGPTSAASTVLSEAAWLGATWRVSPPFSVEFGLRLDAAQYGSPPEYNPAIDSLFGARTDRMPSWVSISPRIGFAWLVHRVSENGTTMIRGQRVGTLFIDMSEVNNEPRGNSGAGTTLFGGIGAYRGTISASRLSGLRVSAGDPGSLQRLDCVGNDVPIPDWSTAASSVFSSCRSDSGGSRLLTAPSVSVLASGFRPAVDWKADLGLHHLLRPLGYVQATLLLLRELDTPSSTDLNLNRSAQFRIASEADRAVLAPASAIVPSTGLIDPSAARLSTRFGPVVQIASNLHRTGAQLDVTVGVPKLLGRFPVELGYALSWQRAEVSGFDGTTGGDPFAVEYQGGAQPIHQFTITSLAPAQLWWFRANVRLNVTSGVPFTPLVSGDINGDGLSNDRAFIPQPGTIDDSAFSKQYAALLAAAPAAVRHCLGSQIGRIAAANSCHTPWHAQVDVTADFAPRGGLGRDRRWHLTTTLINAGAAIARLLGVSSGVVQGSTPVDDRLLYVTGFDPVARRFTYRVNQAFGRSFVSGVGRASYLPFQVRVGVEYALGERPQNPYLHDLGIRKSGVTSADTDLVRRISALVSNPVDTILALRDSLVLDDQQLEALRTLGTQFRAARDSASRAIVDSAARKGARLSDGDMYVLIESYAGNEGFLRSDARDAILRILSPDQQVKLSTLLNR